MTALVSLGLSMDVVERGATAEFDQRRLWIPHDQSLPGPADRVTDNAGMWS